MNAGVVVFLKTIFIKIIKKIIQNKIRKYIVPFVTHRIKISIHS
jgi:hypothetical protein